mgnify:CR=1 FL=1
MKPNTNYNFKEANLDPDFAKDKVKDFKTLIDSSQSFTVVSMPGVGVSYFLKYLASQKFAHFIHIDLYNLPTISKHEFYRMFLTDLGGKPGAKTDEQVFLETKAILKKLAEANDKIVIIFSRFDALKKDLDENFLSNLQSLTTLALGSPREAGKIVLIFTAIKPLYELAPDSVVGGNLTFYSKIYYFKPFSNSDLKALFMLEHTIKAHPHLDKLIELSGGHNQLFHVFMNSHKQNNLLLDKFVTLQLRDLTSYLDYQQKKQIQKVSLGKNVSDIDEYLLGTGYVLEKNSALQIFSPVLQEYIKLNIPHKLPVKEKALFDLLKNSLGKIVSKDEIFNSIWGENPPAGGATDWALDALIYRLRNHPFIKSHGYIIESHKKVGYLLIQT